MEPVVKNQLTVRRAKVTDLVVLSWSISLALSRGRRREVTAAKRVQAVMMMPVMIFLFLIYMPAGDVITTPKRDAVIFLTEARDAGKILRRVGAGIAVFVGSICGLVLWFVALSVLDGGVQPWVALLVPLWASIGLLLVASSTGGSFSAAVEALATRPAGPYWVVQALASKGGAERDGLSFAKEAVETFVPLGVPVLVTAASEKIAVVYERFGFIRQKPGSLNLVAIRA